MSRNKEYSASFYPTSYRGEVEDEDIEEGHLKAKSAKVGDRVIFLTRALVKNNIVGQNIYLILLGMEYLSMLYYIFRLVDDETLLKAF